MEKLSKMWQFLLLLFCLCQCRGLQLSFRYDPEPESQYRVPCGVLLCVEDMGGDDLTGSAGNSSIFSLSISKTVETFCVVEEENADSTTSLSVVATVTSSVPYMYRVSDGAIADGFLGERLASIQLDLFKEEDCSALFTCQLVTVDDKGNKTERFAQAIFRQAGSAERSSMWPSETNDEKDDDALSKQIIGLIEQLSVKLDAVGAETNSTEQKLESMIDSHIKSLEERISASNDIIANVSNELDLIKQSMKDKDGDWQRVVEATNSCSDVLAGIRLLNENLMTGFENMSLCIECQSTSDSDVTTESTTTSTTTTTPTSTTTSPSTTESRLTECKKGMEPLSPTGSSPYPIVYPNSNSVVDVPYLCDTETDGGGWIVIQRRVSPYANFYRGWKNYKSGFNQLESDLWLGLDVIHALTTSATYELRVDLEYKGEPYYMHYSTFSVADETKKYALSLGSVVSGTAGDSLRAVHNNMQFTTFDNDNDNYFYNCASIYSGAWWYNKCLVSNLNGQWGVGGNKGMSWHALTGASSVTFSEMKIRRVP